MGVSIGKLRAGLLIGAGLLVAIVLGFVFYAHRKAQIFLAQLPKKMGINVDLETDNFTFSQSSGQHTVYTIHAAKQIQHGGGKITLRDVSILLYGPDGDRTDRIAGDRWEYDQNTGIVKADGEVLLDLEAPAAGFKGKPEDLAKAAIKSTAKPNTKPSNKPGAAAAGDTRVIHVKTSGVTFDQKHNFATTGERVDFISGGLTGNAIGAQYSSATGVVVLDSAVHVSGLMKDRPVVITAARAELDKHANRSTFLTAKYVSPGQGMEADRAIVYTDNDGTPQSMEAAGHCTVTGEGQGTVHSARMDVMLNPQGKPKTSHLYGGVEFADDSADRGGPAGIRSHGRADDARLTFDATGLVSHVDMTGSVSGEQSGPLSRRSLNASRLVLDFVPDGTATPSQPGHSVLHEAEASGNARLREFATAATPTKATTTDIQGDHLQAHFVTVPGTPFHGKPAQPVARITTLHGTGHTLLHQVTERGVDQTSTGELLDITFRPAGASAKKPAWNQPAQAVELQQAIQRGGVHIVRTVPPKPSAKPKPNAGPDIERGFGDEETYDADTALMTLRGHARVEQPGTAIAATQMTLDQTTGDATADGDVRATYLQSAVVQSAAETTSANAKNLPEPVHVLADRALFKHAIGIGFFYAVPGKMARMWQDTSQVQAPILEFTQTPQKLIARSTGPGDAAMVHAVMLAQPSSKPAGPSTQPATPASKPARTTVVHVAGREMIYTDALHQVELTGRVRVEDPDGVMTAEHAMVYLSPSKTASNLSGETHPADMHPAPKPATPPGTFMAGQVERVVATGSVQVEQPGRRATGQQLVYTAADSLYVMTGTKAAPPRMVSDGRDGTTPGTVVGSALRFHSGDNSVVVTGGDGQNGPVRVRTDTRVSDKEKQDKQDKDQH
jgi:lipopolysaccharide export system protein LptA